MRRHSEQQRWYHSRAAINQPFHYHSTICLIIWSMKHHKVVKNNYHSFTETKVSSGCLLCLTNRQTFHHLSSTDMCPNRVTVEFIESWVHCRHECVLLREDAAARCGWITKCHQERQPDVVAGGRPDKTGKPPNTIHPAEQNTRSCWHTEGAPHSAGVCRCRGSILCASVGVVYLFIYFRPLTKFSSLED